MLKYANYMLASIFIFTYYLYIYYFTYYLLTGNLNTIVKIFLLPHIYEHIIGLHSIKGFQNIKNEETRNIKLLILAALCSKAKKKKKKEKTCELSEIGSDVGH